MSANMLDRIDMSPNAALSIFTGATIALGNLFAPVASASVEHNPDTQALGGTVVAHVAGSALESAGPNLSSNTQLQTELTEEGPDSCLAQEIGSELHLSSEALRAQYLNPANISLGKREVVTNKTDAGEIGCDTQTPVKVANTHKTSIAFTLVAKQVPAASAKYATKTKSGYVLKQEVLGASGEDGLISGVSHLPKKPISSSMSVPVGEGIIQTVGPICDPSAAGTVISGKKTYSQFQETYDQDLAAAQTVCATTPPTATPGATPNAPASPAPSRQPVEPAPPTPPIQPVEPGPPTPPTPPVQPIANDPYTPGESGIDVSDPQCSGADSTSSTIPAGVTYSFGIVGLEDGLGYSSNPCLASEASDFTGTNASSLNYYINTGWYNMSSHINTDSPNVCATGDWDCIAYNYGYNNAIYAIQAANSVGVSVTGKQVSADVETSNTWSTDTDQNQSSIEGTVAGLQANGVSAVLIYSNQYMWNLITGGLEDNLPVWYPTGQTTAADASPYCNSSTYSITGGPVVLTQWVDTLGSGQQVDINDAC